MSRIIILSIIFISYLPLSCKATGLFPLLDEYGYRGVTIYFMMPDVDYLNYVNEEGVRDSADLKIESSNIGYTNFFLDSLSGLEKGTCKYADKNALRLVIDVYSSNELTTYLSDGNYLFGRDLENCYVVPDKFLNKFDIRY